MSAWGRVTGRRWGKGSLAVSCISQEEDEEREDEDVEDRPERRQSLALVAQQMVARKGQMVDDSM